MQDVGYVDDHMDDHGDGEHDGDESTVVVAVISSLSLVCLSFYVFLLFNFPMFVG